jgi:hypothetical protein
MTLAELRTYVRDLTGVYSTDLLPDALLDRWLQESYSELNRADDWPWLLAMQATVLPIGTTTVALTNSAGRVREVTAVKPNQELVQIPSRLGLLQTVQGDDEIVYDINSSGNIVFSKAFKEQVTINVNYMTDAPLIQVTGTATEIPGEYEGILAYRTAVKVLRQQADDSDRGTFYLQEYASMLEDLRTSLIIDNDLGPIQIGGEILRVDGRTIGRVGLRYRSEY